MALIQDLNVIPQILSFILTSHWLKIIHRIYFFEPKVIRMMIRMEGILGLIRDKSPRHTFFNQYSNVRKHHVHAWTS